LVNDGMTVHHPIGDIKASLFSPANAFSSLMANVWGNFEVPFLCNFEVPV